MSDLEQVYQERMRRYVTAMRNEQPDRVPVRLFAEEFASKYAGVSNQDAASDYNIAFDVTRKCAKELGVDAAMSNGIVNWMGMSKMIGWKAATFPGLGIPPYYVTQLTEPVARKMRSSKAMSSTSSRRTRRCSWRRNGCLGSRRISIRSAGK